MTSSITYVPVQQEVAKKVENQITHRIDSIDLHGFGDSSELIELWSPNAHDIKNHIEDNQSFSHSDSTSTLYNGTLGVPNISEDDITFDESESSSKQVVQWKLCARLSEWWNIISHSDRFLQAKNALVSILSTSDHISDIILTIFWFSHGLPIIIPLLGVFFISLTSIAPMFLFEEWYVKIAMPCGFGMVALVYRFMNLQDG
eukprot:UN25358